VVYSIQSRAKWKKSQKNEFPDNMRFVVLTSKNRHETAIFGKHRKEGRYLVPETSGKL
jgi:hypothetical protein